MGRARQLPAVQPHQSRKHPQPEKRHALGHGRQQCSLLAQLQPEPLVQEPPERRQNGPQPGLGGGEHREVIHVPDIAGHALAILEEMVQFPEVQVGEVLAGQVADREAPAGLGTRQQVVDDPVQQAQQGRILELAPAERLQGLVVDALEVPADIAQQVVGELPGALLQTPDRSVGALAPPAGIRIIDQAGLQDRVQHGADRVLDNPVPEMGGADPASLGLADDEGPVGTHPVAAGTQLLLQLQQVGLQVEDEATSARSRFPRRARCAAARRLE